MDEVTAMSHSKPAPIVTVQGTHTSIGQQIGEAQRSAIKHSIENARILVESIQDVLHLSWEGAKNQASKYLPFVQERYPQYLDELLGLAAGSNVTLHELAVVNFLEGVTVDALHLTKCTSLAVNEQNTANQHVLVVHNEDWLPDDEPDLYMVHVKLDDEPEFLAMTYGGLLPNIGFNECGIAQCCDTVYPIDTRIGIPRVIVSRAVLGARTIGESIRRTLVPLRAAGYNHLIAHESGEMYNVEVSARNFDILYSKEGYLAHTNNYLSPKMAAVEELSDELIHTRVRYFRALHLLSKTKLHTTKTLETILQDHVNYPDSICNHSFLVEDPMEKEKTIASVVMDLTARKMEVAWGNPCINKYSNYEVEM